MRPLLLNGRIHIDSVLFATDFSPASYPASLYATAMAAHFSSALIVVHVFLPSQSSQEAEARDGMVSQQRKLLEQQLDRTMQALTPKGGKATSLLLQGDPSVILPKEANRSRGSMLVLGTRGGNSLERRILGSVAENTLRSSAIPTLTVGPHVIKSREVLPFKRILYATDCSAIAAQAAPLAGAIAKSFSSQLEVVSVIDESAGQVSRIVAELDFRTRQELEENLAERCAHFEKPRSVTYSRHAHDEILRRIREDKCDLLVVGIEHHSSLGLLDRNSGAFRIIAESPCPVLTLTRASGRS